LAYEVWFYALFAAAFYLKGAKRVWALALSALFIGPKMLLLLPVWLCGVWCWKRISAPQPMSRRVALSLAIAPPLFYALALALGAPHALMAATESVLSEAFVENALGFSDEFIWNLLLGICAACHFLGMAHLLRGAPARAPSSAARAIRWLAGGSFSLYLAHYPLLQFLDSVLPSGLEKHSAQALLLGLTFALCLAFAQAFERPLPLWRKIARKAFAALAPAGAAAASAPR
jgi:peptidoglycan/LPS O-acetylase OafA/YrhL